jgi:hypothetical protein
VAGRGRDVVLTAEIPSSLSMDEIFGPQAGPDLDFPTLEGGLL